MYNDFYMLQLYMCMYEHNRAFYNLLVRSDRLECSADLAQCVCVRGEGGGGQ